MAKRPPFPGSFWPSGDQELLLRAVLLDETESARSWQRLRPSLDLDELEPGSFSVLPLLYGRLAERGLDDPLLSRLKGLVRYTWSRNQLARDALARVLSVLGDASVETIVTGEAALVGRYYESLGDRAIHELGILVRPPNVERAVDVLAREGWEPVSRTGGHVVLAGPADVSPAPAAVYWRALVEQAAAVASMEDWWAARTAGTVDGAETAFLSPAHELLRTCLRGTRQGAACVWVTDAVAIMSSTDPPLDWDAVAEEAARLHVALRMRDVLAYVRATVDAPVPAAVVERLEGLHASRRERLSYRSGNRAWLPGNLPATVAAHIVATEGRSAVATALTLPRFVVAEWGLRRARELPRAIVSRTRATVRPSG